MTRERSMMREVDLTSIELTRFNDGVNPYPEGDTSLENSFKRGVKFYRDYVVSRTKFVGGNRVLDLLCGCGRWSIFLAEQNDYVVGIDRLPGCTKLAGNLCDFLGLTNTEFVTGEASIIADFKANDFDYVWMWSALQYVHRGEILAQVTRVLKPGGRLYVGNYNSTGLMLQHVMNGIESDTINAGASQWALGALVHGADADGYPSYATPESCASLCERFGLTLIKATPEGALDLSRPNLERPIKPKMKFEHYYTTVEFIAEKRAR